jgi:hypothetical protein
VDTPIYRICRGQRCIGIVVKRYICVFPAKANRLDSWLVAIEDVIVHNAITTVGQPYTLL